MTSIKEIQNKFHEIVNFIKEIFLSALEEEIAKSGGKLLEEAATKFVAIAAESDKTSEEKFSFAYSSVIDFLENEALDYTITAVQGAIIAAYAQYKAGK